MRLAAPKPVSYRIGSDFVLIGRRARHSGGLREKIDLPATRLDWMRRSETSRLPAARNLVGAGVGCGHATVSARL